MAISSRHGNLLRRFPFGCQLRGRSFQPKSLYRPLKVSEANAPTADNCFSKNRQRLFYVLLAFVFILNPAHGAPDVPLNFDGWITEALAKLETDGITGGFHRQTAPLSRTEVAEIIQQAERRIQAGQVVVSAIDRKLLEKLKREFRSEIAGEHGLAIAALPQLRATEEKIAPAIESAFQYTLGNLEQRTVPRLTLYSEFEGQNFESRPLDGKTAEQRFEPWHRARGYIIDFKRSYLQVNSTHLNLVVGRDWLFWGASPYKSVGISDNSPPFDQVRLTGKLGKKLKATAFTTQLDSTWYDDGKKRYLAKRYMSGHRLDYQFNDRVEIGVAEWVLYGGDAQTLEWKYANPITFYYALQYNAKADDNMMFAFDASVRPIDGVRLYGEWLIDDIQYVPTSNDPHSVAWLLGLTWYPPWLERQLGIHSEYARVNRWAYTHLVPDNQFTHFGYAIGHPIGTDTDTVRVSASYQFTVSTAAEIRAVLTRHGEGTIADRFYGEDYESLPFPTGVVARVTEIGGQLSYRPLNAWNASLFYVWEHTQNSEHSLGKTTNKHRLVFHAGYVF